MPLADPSRDQLRARRAAVRAGRARRRGAGPTARRPDGPLGARPARARPSAAGRAPGPHYIPAADASSSGRCCRSLPIVSATGWWPDCGLLMLIAWRLLRADAWPAGGRRRLGFVNDLITGNPIGLSVALWSAIMIALDLIDRRTMWRDYWIEWALAALFIGLAELAQWRVAAIARRVGAAQHVGRAGDHHRVLCFPVAAFLAAQARPLEAGPMKATALHRRAPVDDLFAADDAGRRGAGRDRRRADRPARLSVGRPERALPIACPKATGSS